MLWKLLSVNPKSVARDLDCIRNVEKPVYS
jgi:hypothetical protein